VVLSAGSWFDRSGGLRSRRCIRLLPLRAGLSVRRATAAPPRMGSLLRAELLVFPSGGLMGLLPLLWARGPSWLRCSISLGVPC